MEQKHTKKEILKILEDLLFSSSSATYGLDLEPNKSYIL